jgi:oligopeptide transport system ATP-binding protein
VLEVRDLKMHFPVRAGLLRRAAGWVKAADGVSFAIAKGETLGLVGESGCGKTTVGKCVVRLLRPSGGSILFEGRDIAALDRRALQAYRRRMQMVFQDPFGSLNPRMTVADIVGEGLAILGSPSPAKRVRELLEIVGLAPEDESRYPHEFSGGQRQRIGIARALAVGPSFLVCDEPVSALDVSIQAQIINLLKDLQAKFKDLSYIFIAHDLAVVKHISDRIAVMYLGHIVEITTAHELYENPLHPYTKALLSAIPVPDPYVEETRERIILSGEVPSPLNPPSGCTFHLRCSMATPECSQVIPVLKEVSPNHQVACIKI